MVTDDDDTGAMNAALKGDVAAWAAARKEGAVRAADDVRVPPRKPAPSAARKPKPAAVPVKPDAAAKKPFRMAYDGVTVAEHIQYMIDRGNA